MYVSILQPTPQLLSYDDESLNVKWTLVDDCGGIISCPGAYGYATGALYYVILTWKLSPPTHIHTHRYIKHTHGLPFISFFFFGIITKPYSIHKSKNKFDEAH